jgi:hypothetical protein
VPRRIAASDGNVSGLLTDWLATTGSDGDIFQLR